MEENYQIPTLPSHVLKSWNEISEYHHETQSWIIAIECYRWRISRNALTEEASNPSTRYDIQLSNMMDNLAQVIETMEQDHRILSWPRMIQPYNITMKRSNGTLLREITMQYHRGTSPCRSETLVRNVTEKFITKRKRVISPRNIAVKYCRGKLPWTIGCEL